MRRMINRLLAVITAASLAAVPLYAANGIPDFKPLTPSMKAFTQTLFSAANAKDTGKVLALAHPSLKTCEHWNSGMREKVAKLAILVYGGVDDSAKLEYYVDDKDAMQKELAAAKIHFPILPEAEIVIRRGSRSTALRIARDGEQWRYVWQCF